MTGHLKSPAGSTPPNRPQRNTPTAGLWFQFWPRGGENGAAIMKTKNLLMVGKEGKIGGNELRENAGEITFFVF